MLHSTLNISPLAMPPAHECAAVRACDGHWIWSLAPRFLTTCRECKWSSVLWCPFVDSFVGFQRQSGRCALCMEAQWLAVGACFVATNPAPNDVEDAWLLCVEAIHPGPRLTFDVVRLSYLEQVLCRIRCGVVLQSLFGSRSCVERSCPDPKIPS